MIRPALIAAGLVLATAPAAHAADSLQITLTAQAHKALKARGVKLAATGEASRSGRRVTLPLSSGDTRALRTAGSLRLRARGGRSITLGSPRLELGANPRVSALVGGKRVTLLTLAIAPVSTATGVTLERTAATLAARPAKTIARRLKVRALKRTNFATVAAGATFAAQPLPSEPAGPCKLTTAGGTPPSPGTGVPPVKARPAGARTITGASITWRVRESFIRYIAAGEGTSTSRGAQGDPPETIGSAPPLVYSFHFPFVEGWCDPATGAARVQFSGTVAFRYRDHNIDLVVNDPEVELDGPASRLIFRMTGSRDTAGGNKRAVVATLDVSRAQTATDGTTFTYSRIPGAVPPGAASSVFAGYYLPRDPFGWVSITFTTD
jgi:hypothetical protein